MDKCIEHTATYLLWCPRSLVPEAMGACNFSDKESKDARKQMAVHCADNNATINQQRDQQKWVVVVAAIVTAMAGATATMQQRNNQPTKGSAKWVVVAIDGTTAMHWQ